MKISYNWLKEYLEFNENHESIGDKLTSLGPEVEGITKFESIPGGLNGVVVGKTKSIKKHIIASNEGSAVSIGIGHYLSTKKIPTIYMQKIFI